MQDTQPITTTTTLPKEQASEALIVLYHNPAKDLQDSEPRAAEPAPKGEIEDMPATD